MNNVTGRKLSYCSSVMQLDIDYIIDALVLLIEFNKLKPKDFLRGTNISK